MNIINADTEAHRFALEKRFAQPAMPKLINIPMKTIMKNKPGFDKRSGLSKFKTSKYFRHSQNFL